MSTTDLILEEVSRAVILTVRQNLPEALEDIEGEMVASDAAYFAAIGISPVPATPLPEPAVYMTGSYPDLLDRPIETFPVVTAVCYDHEPERNPRGFDQLEVVTNGTTVEAWVIDPDAERVNRIAFRYAKAIHRVLVQNKDLGGVVEDIYTAPEVTISNVAARRVSDFSEDIVYVQGVRVEYVFRAHPQPW